MPESLPGDMKQVLGLCRLKEVEVYALLWFIILLMAGFLELAA
jgi:hypothetical protein